MPRPPHLFASPEEVHLAEKVLPGLELGHLGVSQAVLVAPLPLPVRLPQPLDAGVVLRLELLSHGVQFPPLRRGHLQAKGGEVALPEGLPFRLYLAARRAGAGGGRETIG